MKTMWKRIAATVLAGAMAISLAACGEGQKKEGGKGSDLFEPGTIISMAVPSHPSWAYNEDWKAWQYFEERTGVEFDVQAIPTSDFVTKVTLMLTSPDTLPDLIFTDGKKLADSFAAQGALVAIDDYMDLMSNYTKFWNSIPEEERELRLAQRRSADGKTYYPQNYGTDSRQGVRSWLYRKDIFDKHNLAVPTTMDELYDISLQLKKLYPDSYPFCQREGLRNISVMGSLWKPDFGWDIYYDYANDKWCYGAIEDTMVDIINYMRKMYEAELLPPNYLDSTTKEWEELMTNDRGFIVCDFVVRIDTFNNIVRTQMPEYTIAAMNPPTTNSPTGTNKLNRYNVDPKGYMIMNTGDEARIENAIKLVDWMYTDEAAELLTWGKEGETYYIDDNGERQFIRPEEGDIEGAYGIFSYGTYLRADPEAAVRVATDEQQAGVRLALDHVLDNYNPYNWVALTDEETRDYEVLHDSIDSYVQEQLAKFLYCQDPMTKWDSYVAEVKKLGVDDMLAIYDAAYKRVK